MRRKESVNLRLKNTKTKKDNCKIIIKHFFTFFVFIFVTFLLTEHHKFSSLESSQHGAPHWLAVYNETLRLRMRCGG